MKVTVHIVKAFTEAGNGGNPAGIVLDAVILDTAMKQSIASRTSTSVTAFLSNSDKAMFKMEFFTPNRQISHSGHGTIAAFSYLVQKGMVKGKYVTKETVDGIRTILLEGDVAYMEQFSPIYRKLDQSSSVTLKNILDSLGLNKSELLGGCYPVIVNTSNPFLIIPLLDNTSLQNIKPDFDKVMRISEELNIVGFYPFTLETEIPLMIAAARAFVPRYGRDEEAATGSAAGALACYLREYLNVGKQKMIIAQGHKMNPPSPSELIIELTIHDEQIVGLLVGGRAKMMTSMDIFVEPV